MTNKEVHHVIEVNDIDVSNHRHSPFKQYARTGRSHCRVTGKPIEKDELRFGTVSHGEDHDSYHWRKWESVTPRILKSLNLNSLEGFEYLTPEDRERVRKAIIDEHV